MYIEIDKGTLFINGTSFCSARCDLGSGDYKIVLSSRDGVLAPLVLGAGVTFVDDGEKNGILVGDYIIDGVAINARATLAKITNKIAAAIDHGDIIELEVM